ncbi:MAG: LuxR C-terminal-related transcriptional regulator [Pseudonocardia sp.]|nr:LuxR C-terminal-related transcriptional regulator [Pseudonocardia sp.]
MVSEEPTARGEQDLRDRGREAYRRRTWSEAYELMSAADRRSPLEPADLELLATAAYLLGRDEDGAELLTRAFRQCSEGDPARAARCAFWLAFHLLNSGELARGGGWVAKARRLFDDGRHDVVEQGYLLYAVALRAIFEGDDATACATFDQAADVGDRFHEPDLVALARVGQGRALIRLGEPGQGMALLDEAMVAVTAGEVAALVAGDVYCTVIEGCQETFDLRRAQEWTAALAHWCASQPDLNLFRGQCLLHRAEIMRLHGAWSDAMDEARRAGERFLRGPGHPAIGVAFYQRAELHRLRGEFVQAEQMYRQANQAGRLPQPGLALMRLAQGDVAAAQAAIRRVLDEADDRVSRATLLPAHVEIMLAAGDLVAARIGADQLSQIAAELGAPLLRAMGAHATGAVLLAEGDGRAAVEALRRGWTVWHELDAPYEAARARVLLAHACRELGDQEGGAMELDAARAVFEQLGAVPDVIRVETLIRGAATRTAGSLTGREIQVLRLVATGMANRAIAAELFLSEKTVARHLSNIFTKLGLSSRSAATAYAYEHDLVHEITHLPTWVVRPTRPGGRAP